MEPLALPCSPECTISWEAPLGCPQCQRHLHLWEILGPQSPVLPSPEGSSTCCRYSQGMNSFGSYGGVLFQNCGIPSASLDPSSDQGSDTGSSHPSICSFSLLCAAASVPVPPPEPSCNQRLIPSLGSSLQRGVSSPPPSHFPSITLSPAPADPCAALCKLPLHVLSWSKHILCQVKGIRATHAP